MNLSCLKWAFTLNAYSKSDCVWWELLLNTNSNSSAVWLSELQAHIRCKCLINTLLRYFFPQIWPLRLIVSSTLSVNWNWSAHTLFQKMIVNILNPNCTKPVCQEEELVSMSEWHRNCTVRNQFVTLLRGILKTAVPICLNTPPAETNVKTQTDRAPNPSKMHTNQKSSTKKMDTEIFWKHQPPKRQRDVRTCLKVPSSKVSRFCSGEGVLSLNRVRRRRCMTRNWDARWLSISWHLVTPSRHWNIADGDQRLLVDTETLQRSVAPSQHWNIADGDQWLLGNTETLQMWSMKTAEVRQVAPCWCWEHCWQRV